MKSLLKISPVWIKWISVEEKRENAIYSAADFLLTLSRKSELSFKVKKTDFFPLKKCTLCAQKSCLIVWRICVDRFFSLSTILWFSVLFLPDIIFSWQFPALWLFGWKEEAERCCIHFVSTPVQKFTHFLFGYILLRERFTPCYEPSSFSNISTPFYATKNLSASIFLLVSRSFY